MKAGPVKRSLVAAALAACAAAQAGQPISLLTPVGYLDQSRLLHKTRVECTLEDKLSADISAEFQRRDNRPGTTTSMSGAVLRVSILASRGIGEGGWTGAKSLTVRAELMSDGTVLRSKQVTGKGRGGLTGAFKGTCEILDEVAEDLARQVVDWSGTTTDAAFDDQVGRLVAPASAASQAAASTGAPSDPAP